MNPTSEDGAVSDVTDHASASAVTVSVVSVTPRPVPSSDAIFTSQTLRSWDWIRNIAYLTGDRTGDFVNDDFL